ncbi:MAG: YcxB family protein [Clostridia bacterium]
MKNEKYVFKTDLRLEDFKGLSWLIVRKTMIVLVFLMDIFISYTLFNIVKRSWPAIVGVFAVLFVLIYLLERVFIGWRSKRVYNLSNVSSELTLVFDSYGITQTSNSGEKTIKWQDIFKVTSYEGCHYVFLNRKQAFYFPKRNFKSAEDEECFCEWIIENIEPYKVRLG